MIRFTRRMVDRDERGAAAVEAAFMVTLVLLPLMIGTIEFGYGFRDWLSVSSATREGARVGSAAGTNSNADCLILEATAGALTAVSDDQVQEVWIFESDTSGSVGNKQRYRPALPADDPASLVCTNWFPIKTNWPPASRVITGVTLDYLGVRVQFGHLWLTNAPGFNGEVTWQDDSIFRMESESS